MEQSKQKYIGLSFTLKGQEFLGLLPAIKEVADQNPGAILVHGFMPREEVVEKGLPLNVVSTIEHLFPERVSFYKDGAVDREGMKDFLYNNVATVYVIGKIKEGVKEEVLLYIKANIKVVTMEYNPEAASGSVVSGGGRFTEADLADFGRYLLSDERAETINTEHPGESVLKEVYHADIYNWKEKRASNGGRAISEKTNDNQGDGGNVTGSNEPSVKVEESGSITDINAVNTGTGTSEQGSENKDGSGVQEGPTSSEVKDHVDAGNINGSQEIANQVADAGGDKVTE